MSLSAERVALAGQAVLSTFEQTCVAWQAIPHWDTQNPGQVQVRSDIVNALDGRTASLPLSKEATPFDVTLARAGAPNPDPLLSVVIAEAAALGRQIDDAVLPALAAPARTSGNVTWYRPATQAPLNGSDVDALLSMLLDGRAVLEDNGYRGGSCLLAGTVFYRTLNTLVSGVVVADELMRAGGVRAAYRASQLDAGGGSPLMIMLGRRQDLPDGPVTHASAGEEPVDLAVSVPPSLEVVGDTAAGAIELAVRIRYALRMKDDHGVVVFHS